MAVNATRPWSGWRLLVVFTGMAWAGVSTFAANRTVNITAPAAATAGSKVDVTIAASTDAGGGERIGFFHADYSVDGGATWTGISYAANEGPSTKRSVKVTTGAAGSKTLIRVRVAFRGGKAGDVDFSGKPIVWDASWGKWEEPPTKTARITILPK